MHSDLLYVNGVNDTTGGYLRPAMTVHDLSAALCRRRVDIERTELLECRIEALGRQHLGAADWVDPCDLASSGWGVVFAQGADPAIEEALTPLLAHRAAQARQVKECRYRRILYQPEESVWQFLDRHQVGWGPAEPDKLPYYLLLVGSPQDIPFEFQYDLDLEYAVGRIVFDTPADYGAYAASVLEAETASPPTRLSAAFFAPHNNDDQATHYSRELLAGPLSRWCREQVSSSWKVRTRFTEKATKQTLGGLLGGDQTPDFLLSASHGVVCPYGDRRQRERQGAILCQDWPGPEQWRQQPLAEEHAFAASDLASDARLHGLIVFHFGCYGGGTPAYSSFPKEENQRLTEHDFVARLPQRLLAQGARAVITHVDQVWAYSYLGLRGGQRLETFKSTLRRLLEGHPVGSAMDYIGHFHAALGATYGRELQAAMHYGKQVDKEWLVSTGTALEDARNYIVLGDPAVRLPVEPPTLQTPPRPTPPALTDPQGDALPPVISTQVLDHPGRAPREPAPPVRDRPIRMLAAVSAPSDSSRYKLGEIDRQLELQVIQEALAEASQTGQIELTSLPSPVTIEALSESLRSVRPHVLYLLAHGKLDATNGRSILFLEQREGSSEVVAGSRLVELIGGLSQPPHLVHLASCESAAKDLGRAFRGVGPSLERAGVPAVLAMQGQVPIATARLLSGVFYRELLEHGQVDEAWRQARHHLQAVKVPGDSLPVLFSHLADGRLFDPGAFDFRTSFATLRKQLADTVERYVPLAVQRAAWVEQQWNRAGEDLPLTDLEQHRQVVLLGEPGSGKTTALKLLAAACLANPGSKRVHLPLLLQLRDWNEIEGRPTGRLLRLLANALHSQNACADQPTLEEVSALLEQGQPLAVLCDGLNEIEESCRHDARRALAEFAQNHQHHRWLLTTRPQGFEPLEEWEHFEVAPLDDQRIRDLLWRATHDDLAAGRILDVARGAAGSFLRIPLFLTFTIDQQKNLALLEQSADSVSALLRGYTESQLTKCSSPKAAKRVLLHVAQLIQNHKVPQVEGLGKHLGKETAGLVNELCDAGLLVRRGLDRVDFRHPILRDYFSAAAFIERWFPEDSALRRAGQTPWSIKRELRLPQHQHMLALAVAHLDATELPTALQVAMKSNPKLTATWVDDPDVERRAPGVIEEFSAALGEYAKQAMRPSQVLDFVRWLPLSHAQEQLLLERGLPLWTAVSVAVFIAVIVGVPWLLWGPGLVMYGAGVVALLLFLATGLLIWDHFISVKRGARLDRLFAQIPSLHNTALRQRLGAVASAVEAAAAAGKNHHKTVDLGTLGAVELVRRIRKSPRRSTAVAELATIEGAFIQRLLHQLISYENELSQAALTALVVRSEQFPERKPEIVRILQQGLEKLPAGELRRSLEEALGRLGHPPAQPTAPASPPPKPRRFRFWYRNRGLDVDWRTLVKVLEDQEKSGRTAQPRAAT